MGGVGGIGRDWGRSMRGGECMGHGEGRGSSPPLFSLLLHVSVSLLVCVVRRPWLVGGVHSPRLASSRSLRTCAGSPACSNLQRKKDNERETHQEGEKKEDEQRGRETKQWRGIRNNRRYVRLIVMLILILQSKSMSSTTTLESHLYKKYAV